MGGKRTLRLTRFNNRVVYPCGFERRQSPLRDPQSVIGRDCKVITMGGPSTTIHQKEGNSRVG